MIFRENVSARSIYDKKEIHKKMFQHFGKGFVNVE